MKSTLYLFIAFALLSFSVLEVQAQSTNQNYIITTVPIQPITDPSTLTDANSNSTIQYIDCLGRPIETVQRGITPLGSDLVSVTEYDDYGRESKHWLPTPMANNQGNYVDATVIASAASNAYSSDARPFTVTQYEASPMNRITGQFGAGADWFANNKKISTSYQSNVANEVAHFYVNSSNQLQRDPNCYAANTLYKNQTTDEDGNTTTEYKDKLGQVVMKRSSTNVDTYYVYNDFGQLSYVLPPNAVDLLTSATYYDNSNPILTMLAYLYQYDVRGNNIVKRLPGCDYIYMVYDKANRLVLTQDGNQRLRNEWLFNKYDVLGRLILTGKYTDTRTLSDIHAQFDNTLVVEEYKTGNNYNYTWIAAPIVAANKVLTVNYYDSSSRDSNFGLGNFKPLTGYDSPYTDPSISSYSEKGLLTKTGLIQSTNYGIATAYYYDDKGRLVQTCSANQLGGYDITYHHFDFSGNVLNERKEHNISGVAVIPEVYTYTYDKAERLKTTTYQLNNKTSVTYLASKTYDEEGRLSTNSRHNQTDQESYMYNIRNWVTKLKSGTFEENLYYNSNLPTGVTACYNGNISYSSWTYNNVSKGYAYAYDGLNRLTYAAFKKGTSTQNDGYFDEQFTFDKQGNISYLKRKKDNVLIDDLYMVYCNGSNRSNQVLSVYDYAGSQNQYLIKEYNSLASSSDEFSYDKNGNMIKDLDRNIVTIRYNYLNLPDTIQFGNGNQIVNSYTADGRKIETEYFTNVTGITLPIVGQVIKTFKINTYTQNGTIYVDNKEYTTLNGNLDPTTLPRVYNEEGYAENIAAATPNYYYYRRDHLGNNREVWLANTNITQQRTQYYPSGLPWAAVYNDAPGLQERKYNGKEFVEMCGYDTYDYGARGYYPAMGRFMSMDPLAEKYYSISPYAYCGGNPVNRFDPDGRDWYQSGNSVIWQKGSEEMDGYKNIGTSYTQKIDDKTSITWDNDDKGSSMTETVLQPEDFSSQMKSDGSGKKDGEAGNCFVQSEKMVEKSGAKSEDSPKKGIKDPEKELDYISTQADLGKSTRAQVDRDGDGKGDHWVASSSVTTDLKTNTVTSVGYFDPATRQPKKGTNNSFNVCKNKSLSGKPAYSKKYTYTVVQVRKNKN